MFGARLIFESARQEPEKDIYQKSHDQARGLKTDRVPIIFINKYFTQFIPGKQEGYATTTESLPTLFQGLIQLMPIQWEQLLKVLD